ncbi:AI-2E family transporter [Mucilaginibacter rubeus]|uniref:AI-2E family transporter n=1 Tax=Mucilaginibacter rubeus TaxID=2027860 RepID=A0AAE6MKV7_9SPHI|nr:MULTISPECIES: AI-2E family transporter [Mucilaginibacter]QEM06607.1 AI-2E family transporter [Mucilaginibacter rubeus]QEM19196.1 AI-2E family transporter [Mucilaginibacter gossypii]QTE44261.1 AI-2E family transporter [Mucilaginibacter rubeus]QTE50861.1 AI-2E family transporter [Mucilaginibacter rubeus]QTE55943.1 AI-2E family transporter [Mucilaginibacter rubeus]
MNDFIKKTFIVTGVILLALTLGFAANVFLLAFAAILFASLLVSVANKIKTLLRIKYHPALAITCTILLLFIGGLYWLMAPSLSDQFAEFKKEIPTAIENLKSEISKTSIGKDIVDQLGDSNDFIDNHKEDIVSKTTGIFSSVLSSVVNLFLILISGIFLATEPETYLNGLLFLFPDKVSKRLKPVFLKGGETLINWLKGKFIGMFVIGILTYVGLIILNFPIPVVLAFIAMVFTFIPNVGPLIALGPAILIGLLDSPERALHVAILFTGIQVIESYFITPFINKKSVSLPPALTLFWQILLGMFLGSLGLFLATPLLAVIIVFIKELYKPQAQRST